MQNIWIIIYILHKNLHNLIIDNYQFSEKYIKIKINFKSWKRYNRE